MDDSDTNSIIFMILLQVVLIMLNAIFACAEIAVISMNDNKLNKMATEGDKRAIRLVKLTEQPARFLATIQVAITLSGFLGSAFAAENFSGVLVDWVVSLGVTIPVEVLDSIAVILITIILSYFTLVFGELLPKQIAMRNSEQLALGLSGLISGIAKAFAPIVSFLTFSTNSCLRLCGIDPNQEGDEVSEEEIRMMVDVGTEKGTIDHEEREFIQNVFEFDDLTAEEIATHRTDVIMLDVEDSTEVWKETIYYSRYTHFPVCKESADNIVGVLDTKIYFRLEDKSRENIMEQAVSPAYFVPEKIKADILFQNMKKERSRFAIVLDEYGGVTGIITINDLVEQLVGDLIDEYQENVEDSIVLREDGSWMVSGSASLEEISIAMAVSLPCEDYDTFNGFVFHALESVPDDGEEIEFDYEMLHIKILKIKNHQVEKAIIYMI